MVIERARARTGLVLVGLLALAGCSAASSANEVSRIRTLTGNVELRPLAVGAVEETTGPEAVAELTRAPLDANAAVRIALLNNQGLRARLRELGIARGRIEQAGLVANPTLEFEVLPERDSKYELRVEYQITSLILAPLRAQVAEAELEAERHQVAARVVQLGFEVRTAFYELQAAERRLELARASLEIFAASREAADALLAAGNVPPNDATAEGVAHEHARVAVTRLELEATERREAVHRLLGVHGPDTAWQIEPELPDVPASLPADAAEQEAIERSHDLAALRSRLDAVGRRTRLSRTEGWLPDVSLDVHALQGNPEQAPGRDFEPDWRFGGGFSVSLPLFDRRQGAIRADEAEFDATLERYQGLAVEIRSELRTARARLRSAHRQVRSFDEGVLPAQRMLMKQTLLQYNAMQIGVFDLLRARRQQIGAERARLDAVRDYWTADAALQALRDGSRVEAPAATPAPGTITAADARGGH